MTGTVILCLVVALVVVLAFDKPRKTLVGGIFQKDSKGRMVLVLTPTPKPRRKKKGRR